MDGNQQSPSAAQVLLQAIREGRVQPQAEGPPIVAAPAPVRPASLQRPSVPVVTGAPAPAAEREQTSLLEQLRQRVSKDFEVPTETPAAFSRGVLSNRGSFLDNLAAGVAAQQEAAAARREEGRKAAEVEAAIIERDRRAALEKAKFAEETTPGTLTGRLREAQIAQALATAGAAGQPNYQVVGTNAQGDAIIMNPRTGRTETLTGVRPTRTEIAEITARTQARRSAEQAADRDVQALQREIQQGIRRTPAEGMEAYREGRILFHQQRLLAGQGSEQPAPMQQQQPPAQRFQYTPPR